MPAAAILERAQRLTRQVTAGDAPITVVGLARDARENLIQILTRDGALLALGVLVRGFGIDVEVLGSKRRDRVVRHVVAGRPEQSRADRRRAGGQLGKSRRVELDQELV